MLNSLISVLQSPNVAQAPSPATLELERELYLRIVDLNSIFESNESWHGRVAVPKIIGGQRPPGNERR
jgi:hypothetical protein